MQSSRYYTFLRNVPTLFRLEQAEDAILLPGTQYHLANIHDWWT